MIAPALAVLNSVKESKVERREAFQTYGPPPPPQQSQHVPHAVYGVPASQPPLSVPVQKYGPPKIQVEYGPPSVSHSHSPHHHIHQQFGGQQFGGQQFSNQYSNQQSEVSFLDQIKSSFGIQGGQKVQTSYGPPPQPPRQKYGPPKNSYGLPSSPPSSFYGPPSKPQQVYGPPPTLAFSKKPQSVYGPPQRGQPSFNIQSPASTYGLPTKAAVNFHAGRPQQVYGAPSRPPPAVYGAPQFQQQPHPLLPPKQFPAPSFNVPSAQYGPPAVHHQQTFHQQQSAHHQQVSNGPLPVRCDGWKPILGPVIQTTANNGAGSVHSIQSVQSVQSFDGGQSFEGGQGIYLPPPSNALTADVQIPQQSSGISGLELPISEPERFHSQSKDITSFDIIKSNGIEVICESKTLSSAAKIRFREFSSAASLQPFGLVLGASRRHVRPGLPAPPRARPSAIDPERLVRGAAADPQRLVRTTSTDPERLVRAAVGAGPEQPAGAAEAVAGPSD